jgi:hypothetical protein
MPDHISVAREQAPRARSDTTETMTTTGFISTVAAITVVAVSLGCGDATEDSSPSGARERGAQAPASASSAARTELTSEALSAYERGMRREIEAVRAAQQRSTNAKTAQERGEAIQSAFEHATTPLGAEAAGLPAEQYRAMRETVHHVFETLDFQGKIDGPLSMDLARADDATKQRLARDAFADLSPASAEALRSAMNRLVPVWVEYVTLTAVAG